MTKKHFEAIAQILNLNKVEDPDGEFDAGYDWAVSSIAEALCDVFEVDNPNFNRTMFLAAAGCAA